MRKLRTLLILVVAAAGVAGGESRMEDVWSKAEMATLESLWIGNLPALPPSPGNRYADDPRAAELGRLLFFEQRFSKNGQVSCATCHDPELAFQDGKQRGEGIGVADRRTMSLAGVAFSEWFFWDGRADSLWSQALGPLENPAEHGGTREQYARVVANDSDLKSRYEAVFGKLPASLSDRDTATRVFVNLGKAIEAFERRIMPSPAPFDQYVEALREGDFAAARSALNSNQLAGLRLFIGKALCLNCHSGPLFTNHEFHNTGLNPANALPTDRGRISGVRQALSSEFRCGGEYSDAGQEDCTHLKFVKTSGSELVAAFKTPSLRNVAARAPYMHDGRFAELAQVIEHYSAAAPTMIGHELLPLSLSTEEKRQLESFLHALSAQVRIRSSAEN